MLADYKRIADEQAVSAGYVGVFWGLRAAESRARSMSLARTGLCYKAKAIGDPAEVGRLLAGISYVGKRRSNGFGEVCEWRVEPLEAFTLVRDERLTRSIPAEAVGLLQGYVPEGAPLPVAWTPPQWKPALFRPGWWTDTPCQMDWFKAVDGLGG